MASLTGEREESFDHILLNGNDIETVLNAKQDQANAFDGQYSSLSGTPNIEYTSPIPTATTSSDGLMASSDKISLDGKQNVIQDGDLTIFKTNGLQSALDAKQNTIQDNDLTISKTNNLQSALDAKQNTIQDNDLTISKTSGLQSALDSKANANQIPTISQSIDSSEINVPSNNAVLTALSAKQNAIQDNDLTISKTNNLQSSLDAKQNVIQDNDLTISKTNNLQSSLDAKQNAIQDNDLSISKTNNLQTSLDAKVNRTSPHFFSNINTLGSLKLGNDGGWYQTIEWTADQQPANSFIAFKLTNLGTPTQVLKIQGDSKVYITGDLDVTGSVSIPDSSIDYNTKLANKPSIPTTISYQYDNLGTYQLSASVLHDMNASNTVYKFTGTVNNNLISHTAHTEIFTINQDGWYIITVMLTSRDGASNNRSLIFGTCKVFTSIDTVKNTYMLGNCYYRDDNNNYDDCIINNTITVFLKTNESFKIQTFRSYTESVTGAINCTVAESYIDIEYAAAVLS